MGLITLARDSGKLSNRLFSPTIGFLTNPLMADWPDYLIKTGHCLSRIPTKFDEPKHPKRGPIGGPEQ